jgi:recombinational DNA repair protein (RecF pathway)
VESRFRLWRTEDAVGARVTGGGVEKAFPRLRSDWRRMAAAQSLCEWTERLTPLLQPAPEKYDLLLDALAALETSDPPTVRAEFMVQFLVLAGYNPYRDIPALSNGKNHAPFSLLERQLIQFVAPLVHGPFKASVHEASLLSYYTAKK